MFGSVVAAATIVAMAVAEKPRLLAQARGETGVLSVGDTECGGGVAELEGTLGDALPARPVKSRQWWCGVAKRGESEGGWECRM